MSDPRPATAPGEGGRHVLLGARCRGCYHALARRLPRCPRCASANLIAARFGPDGAVWAATTVHVPTPDRPAPYELAYVDLDDGPRLLALLTAAAPVGARVALTEPSPLGDPRAEPLP